MNVFDLLNVLGLRLHPDIPSPTECDQHFAYIKEMERLLKEDYAQWQAHNAETETIEVVDEASSAPVNGEWRN